jgi:hypothetical protein
MMQAVSFRVLLRELDAVFAFEAVHDAHMLPVGTQYFHMFADLLCHDLPPSIGR